NGQTKVDYTIGLRSGDIGDYSPPSERLYTQVFNQTGLQTLVYTRYIPGYYNSIANNNDQTSNLPFYYRIRQLSGLAWWIILIIVIGILTLWLILSLIIYLCCRKRLCLYLNQSKNSFDPETFNSTIQAIDMSNQEENSHFQSSVTIKQESMVRPELRVRRLSQEDWPYFNT
ncbi:unnamed protein product, partial [Rotaria socialis]